MRVGRKKIMRGKTIKVEVALESRRIALHVNTASLLVEDVILACR